VFTVRDLLNRFLTSKKLLLDGGELTKRTFADYHASCAGAGAVLGLTRLLDDRRLVSRAGASADPGGAARRRPPGG
jgi:hypothetical protein